MLIDKAFLTEVLSDLKRQEQEALFTVQRAQGAILLAEAMLKKVDEVPEPSSEGSGDPVAPA